MDPQIPDKLYFKIGEVAELTGIKAHVLRYWEAEFSAIRPTKSRSKQRLYRKQDIEKVLYLKDLLYNQGYTIAGARKLLRRKPAEQAPEVKTAPQSDPSSADEQMTLQFNSGIDMDLLREIKQDILALKKSLGTTP